MASECSSPPYSPLSSDGMDIISSDDDEQPYVVKCEIDKFGIVRDHWSDGRVVITEFLLHRQDRAARHGGICRRREAAHLYDDGRNWKRLRRYNEIIASLYE